MSGGTSYDPFSTFLKESTEGAKPTARRVSGMAHDVLVRLGRSGGSLEDAQHDLGLTALQAARAVVELEGSGLITVERSEKGETTTLTQAGLNLLG